MPTFDPASDDAMEVLEASDHLAQGDASMDRATSLCENLHLHDARAATDVTFLVGGETFTAHRSVLAARSPALVAEFFTTDTNTTGDCIRIDDMTAQVFKTVLHFVYTGSIPPEMEKKLQAMAEPLLAAADRFGLQELKEISEEILCDEINGDIITEMFHLSVQHHPQRLHEACIVFLECCSSLLDLDIMGDGWLVKHMAKSCPEILKNLYDEWSECCGSYFNAEPSSFEAFAECLIDDSIQSDMVIE